MSSGVVGAECRGGSALKQKVLNHGDHRAHGETHGNSVNPPAAVCRLTNSFSLYSQRRALGISNCSVLSVISVVRPVLVCAPRPEQKRGGVRKPRPLSRRSGKYQPLPLMHDPYGIAADDSDGMGPVIED